MGEVQAGSALVRQLLARYPTYQIVMTTMTTTGAARVKSLFPERVTHCYLPYDLPFAVRGFLDRAKPKLAVILETELWPNLLRESKHRRIPVVVASARISPRTADRYRRLANLFRDVLSDVTIAAQTEADAERFKALGAANVQVTGNIKFDIEIPDSVCAAGSALRERFGSRFVWVAGSTHAGEEDAAIAAHRKLLEQRTDALLVLVPRHPQRFQEVRDLLGNSGMKFVTRSSGALIANDTSIVLVDTMGELLNFYAGSDVAYVGGSLVPVGGHNLLEPAALSVPTLCGPYMFSAKDVFDKLLSMQAIQCIESPGALAAALLVLEANPSARANRGRLALDTVAENRGAIQRVLALVAPLVT
jgi:3-deoxy-D-manno-octulosonic-acid transferase